MDIDSDMTRLKALEILRRVVPNRVDSNKTGLGCNTNYKGVHGRIGIVGGARDYAGAPYFASMSAMRLGADLSYVICSRDASQVIKNYSPDLIVSPLLDHPDDNEFDKEMDCLLSRLHALVIGPGLGREKIMLTRARRLIERAKERSLPLVLDADSLMLVNDDLDLVRAYPKVILTPNRVELQRLLDSVYSPKVFNLRDIATNEIKDLVRKCSTDLKVSILAKGMVDIVCDDKNLELCTDQHSGSNRRCGGQGDITCGLAGVLIHWIERSNKAVKHKQDIIESPMAWAGYLAVMLTRRINELAYAELKSGMLASDMVNRVYAGLESLLDEADKNGLQCRSVYEYAGILSKDEINRYTRQMIMEEFGPTRQANLKNASALIIGAGGLGCPASIYLGAAGIGHLGLVDDDRVEASNLHRQILHSVDKIGMLKTNSIRQAVQAVNPNVRVTNHSIRMSRYNAVDLVEKYDIILDCTDNLLTRYMISDACVIAKKPLVSGAALKMDGQLTVYNYDQETPCFRCLFPDPPPPNAVGSCSENGVLGVIPGVVGIQQALEAIKIAAGLKPAYAGKMLLFDGQLGLFRHITLGKRKKDCEACGTTSTLKRDLLDYSEFCGLTCQVESKPANILNDDERVTVEQYMEIIQAKKPHLLVDVRPIEHSNISRLKNAIQMPVMSMAKNPKETLDKLHIELERNQAKEIFVVCRKGIASQRGTRILQELLKDKYPDIKIKDIIGGMTTWAARVDPSGYSCL